jgi:hypothetical protein
MNESYKESNCNDCKEMSNYNEDIINISDLLNSNKVSSSKKLVDQIRKHGYILIDVKAFEGSNEEALRNVGDNSHSKYNVKRNKGSVHIEDDKKDRISCNESRKNDRRSEQLTNAAKWREVFATAFDQSLEAKEDSGKFRMDKSLSVGYKRDDTREFFETRLFKDKLRHSDIEYSENQELIEPDFPHLNDYTKTVLALFNVLNDLGVIVLSILTEALGLDR